MPPSKNQRSSIPSQATGPMQLIGDVRLITPLNQGKHAYVLNPVSRRNMHVATGSDAFTEVIAAVAEAGHGDRVLRQLDDLALTFPEQDWAAKRDRLIADGVLVRSEQ